MRNRILRIGIPAVVVVVAVVIVAIFLFSDKSTYVNEPDSEEFKSAYKLLNEAYLDEGEDPDVYYVDFMVEHDGEIGSGEDTVDVSSKTTTDEEDNEVEVQAVSSNVFVADTDNEDYTKDDDIKDAIVSYDNNMVCLNYLDTANYEVNVDKAGLYYMELDYASIGTSMSDYTIQTYVNGESQFVEANTVVLPVWWHDEMNEDGTKTFQTDKYNDEMALSQSRIDEWYHRALYNNTYSSATPLCFYLEAGSNTITFTNTASGGLALGQLTVSAAENDAPSYADYSAEHSDASLVSGADMIEINAINYVKKNSTDAIYESIKNSSLAPFDIDNDKINALTMTEAGNEVTYEFTVEKAGLYNLATHYRNKKDEFSAFLSVMIDGEIPFAEMNGYEVKSTGNGWENEVFRDENDNPYGFYLEEGTHTLTIKLEQYKVMEAYRYALLVQRHVTKFQLEITKITGAEVDTDRTWQMTKYIRGNDNDPETIKNYLDAYSILLQKTRYLLQDFSENGNTGAILAYLDKAETYIEDDVEYPDEIALHVDDLTGAENSILQAVSTFTTALLGNDITFDRMYFYADEDNLPAADQNILVATGIGAKELLNTFISSKYSTKVTDDGDKVITVWVSRAVTHVDLMQKMADTQFTPETGITVKITTMPDVNRLTLAVAANEAPTVALGLQSYVPFELASRGAIYDLTEFDDYWTVMKRFPAGSLVSYIYNEDAYAIPETTDFNCIAYRSDIFDNLGLEVPSTWDELVEILPTLQRYGQNFYHNVALASTSYKWFFQTTPLILQNGGSLYTEDGLKTAIDSKEAVKGLETLGNLFTKYSVDSSVGSFFNSFRYSEIPIGIVGMEDYTLISNGAPELEGQWKISEYLGTEREDGTIDRTFIANGTGGVIFGRNAGEEPTEAQQNAWEYLKWWTSADVQREYAYTLRSTNGKAYFWLSANLEALQDVPMEQADKQVVLDQIEWVTDINRTPGQYLLERTISNIWNSIVNDNTPAQIAVDESVNDVNKEIKRKMTEFGFIDEDGNKLKDYVIRDKAWIQEQMDNAPEEEE